MICADFDTFLLAIIPPSPSIHPPNISWCALPTLNIFLLSITEPTADAVDEMAPNQAHESSPIAHGVGITPMHLVWASSSHKTMVGSKALFLLESSQSQKSDDTPTPSPPPQRRMRCSEERHKVDDDDDGDDDDKEDGYNDDDDGDDEDDGGKGRRGGG